jgi:hypothetical protein
MNAAPFVQLSAHSFQGKGRGGSLPPLLFPGKLLAGAKMLGPQRRNAMKSEIINELNRKAPKEHVHEGALRFTEFMNAERKAYIDAGGSALAFLDLSLLQPIVYYATHFARKEMTLPERIAALQLLDSMMHRSFEMVAKGMLNGTLFEKGKEDEANL